MNLLDVLRSIAPQSVIACLQAKLQAGLPVTLEDLQGQLEKYTDGLAREMGVFGAAVDALQGGMDAALEDLQGYRAQLDALGRDLAAVDRAVQENQVALCSACTPCAQRPAGRTTPRCWHSCGNWRTPWAKAARRAWANG